MEMNRAAGSSDETRVSRRGETAPGGRPDPGRLRIWLQAVRPFSFTASIVPILVATSLALADGAFRPLLAAAMLLASVACQAGANLANDYFDHVNGIDTQESLGPSQVIQQGLLAPAAVRRGMLVAFGTATTIGLGIVAATGWPVLVLALVGLAAAYLYTGGPRPLGYVALGEITVFLTMGVGMVVGGYYVLTGHVTVSSVLTALPVACLVAVILHVNNMRDVGPDRVATKVTLATLVGRRLANAEYTALVAGAFVATAALVAAEKRHWPALLVLFAAPGALRLVRSVWTAADPSTLNAAVRRTAGLHLRVGLLLSAGLLVGAVLGR